MLQEKPVTECFKPYCSISSNRGPVMNTYVFKQEELEGFLKDYTRHGELVVSVKQVGATA